MKAIPARMSFEDCARRASSAHSRVARAAKAASRREVSGPWSFADPPQTPWAGGDLTRLTLDWVASCVSPDEEMRGSMKRLRARARELERNNAYAEAYLGLLAANVVGAPGYTPPPRVSNTPAPQHDRINDRIEDAWEEWGGSVSRDGKLGLTEFLQLAIKTVARDGECFVRLWTDPDAPYGTSLEFIDSDIIDESFMRGAVSGGNEVRMGVEVDAKGRPVAYHALTKLYSNYPTIGTSYEREPIPASEVLHLYRPRRGNQTRGVTWLGPAMIALRMLDGYEEAELVAARTAAAKMGFFKSGMEAGEAGPDDPKDPIQMDAAPGTMEKLPQGWDFVGWDPKHPTAAFPAFVKTSLRKIASALHVSYNALTSDLESVNYSSMRSGLLIERDTHRMLQQWLIGRLLRPVRRVWTANAMLSGDLVLDSRDFRKFLVCKYTPRGWPAVDPLKDVTAEVIAIQNGLGSRTEYLAAEGTDYEQTINQLDEENQIAAEANVEIHGGARAATDPAAGNKGQDTTTDGTQAGSAAGAAGQNGTNGHRRRRDGQLSDNPMVNRIAHALNARER